MEIAGLPLHPLVVHGAVVLSPLAALVALAYAGVPGWRWLLRWPLVAGALVAAGACVAAYLSGNALLDQRPELGPLVEVHQDRGAILMWLSLTFVVDAALAAWALGGPSPLTSGRGAQESRGAVGVVAVGLLAGGAVAMVVMTVLTGDAGARAVWG
jgi:hypothetical protein